MQPRDEITRSIVDRLRTREDKDPLSGEAADLIGTLRHDLANAKLAEQLVETLDAEIAVIRAEHTALLELEKAVRAYGSSGSATWTGVQRVLDELAAARDARATTERPAEALPQHDHEMSNPMNDPEEG